MALGIDAISDSPQTPVTTVSADRSHVVLTIGSHHMPALLCEQSPSEFLILLPHAPAFWVEDTGQLQTDCGSIEVRVANIARAVQDGDADEENCRAFWIGLERPSEKPIEQSGDVPPMVPVESLRADIKSRSPKNRRRALAGGFFTLVLVSIPLMVVAIVWIYHSRHAPSTEGASGETTVSEKVVAGPTPDMFSLPGIEPFVVPEVAAKLEFTPSQEDAYLRLQQTTNSALADLDKYWQSVGRFEQARRRNLILDAAREEALGMLSEPQRSQWDALTHGEP